MCPAAPLHPLQLLTFVALLPFSPLIFRFALLTLFPFWELRPEGREVLLISVLSFIIPYFHIRRTHCSPLKRESEKAS
jgi:hypothetical protein